MISKLEAATEKIYGIVFSGATQPANARKRNTFFKSAGEQLKGDKK